MGAIGLQAKYTYRTCLFRLLSLHLQSRTFASTPICQRHGNLPNFTPTSSTELDALFATFRANIFIPAHLSKAQRNLIYRKKNHALLTGDEPATAAIGDEVVRMVPLSHQHDEPNSRSSLTKVLDLMKTDIDWHNLSEFLAGLKTAKRKVKPWQAEKIARKACMTGRWRTIMVYCEKVERTGFGLWQVGVVRELLWTAMGKAQRGEWTKGAVEKALKLANVVWTMMQDPRHKFTREKGPVDPMRRPDIVGVMLQLHAARILRSGDRMDREGKVQEYVERLLAIWNDADLHVHDENDENQILMKWAPVWHGMKMAQQVLGANAAKAEELGNKLTIVENSLHKARDVTMTHQAEGETRRGLKVYEELFSVSS